MVVGGDTEHIGTEGVVAEGAALESAGFVGIIGNGSSASSIASAEIAGSAGGPKGCCYWIGTEGVGGPPWSRIGTVHCHSHIVPPGQSL